MRNNAPHRKNATLRTSGRASRAGASGFTLTELAVVLVIIALMIGGMLLPLAAQDDIRRTQETQKALNDARDALVGFATATGRLPCPATDSSHGFDSNGLEAFCTNAPDARPPTNACLNPTTVVQAHGRCFAPFNGFLPAASLGLQPISAQGLLVDGWGQAVRYALDIDQWTTAPFSYAFSGANGMRTRGIENLAPTLRVCSTGNDATLIASAGTAGADCLAANRLAVNAVTLFYSLGPNGSRGGSSLDEKHNPNPGSAVAADRVFVHHVRAPADAADGEFDDLVLWLSPNILYNRLIAAGRLP
jgi:prepilin-type N-terminal cleavage/methylation domain-containing protein